MAGKKLDPKNYPGGKILQLPTGLASHETWNAWAPEWEFLLDAFEGGQTFIKSEYLFKHERESQKGYNGRIARAYYLNYVQLVIDLWTSYMQRTPPKRFLDNQAGYKKFAESIDMYKHSINEFWIGRIFPLVQALGMVHIVLQDYVPPGTDTTNIKTMQDQLDAGITDRAVVYKPQDMINWKKDPFGRYQWCMFRKYVIVQDDWKDERKEETHYIVFTKTQELLLDSSGKTIVETFNHNLGFVPVVTAMGRQSERWLDLGLAEMYDVAIINREVFNISSLIQEFLYKQCFNFLAGPDDVMSEEEGSVKLSTQGILPIYDDRTYAYVSPPIDPAQFLQNERGRLIQEMYRQSVIRDKSIETTDPASGVSKLYDVVETGQNLAKKASRLQDAENEFWMMYAKKRKITIPDDKQLVTYPKEYDTQTINEALASATQTFKLNLSETLNKTVAKQLAKKLVPNVKQETKVKIEKEIEVKDPAENDMLDFDNKRPVDQTNVDEKGKTLDKGGKPASSMSQKNNTKP